MGGGGGERSGDVDSTRKLPEHGHSVTTISSVFPSFARLVRFPHSWIGQEQSQQQYFKGEVQQQAL